MKPVLIYDGRCRFCTSQAERLARWTGGRVRLASFREPGVIARYPGLTAEQCEQALQFVEPDGRVSSGAEAVARALRLRPLLAPFAALYYLPGLRQVLDWDYRVVAKNRFRLRGEVCTDDGCHAHR